MAYAMTPTDPESILAEREATAAKMQRELDLYRAQTDGMRMAFATIAQARGTAAGASTANAVGVALRSRLHKLGGRPAGAISNAWRNVLHHLHQAYGPPSRGFSAEGFLNCAQKTEGVGNLRLPDAKNRILEYRKHGYIEPADTEGLYHVTDYAMKRFADWGWKPGEFNPPSAEAPGENESSATGDQTGG